MCREADRQEKILWDQAPAGFAPCGARRRNRLNRAHIFALDHLFGHRSH